MLTGKPIQPAPYRLVEHVCIVVTCTIACLWFWRHW